MELSITLDLDVIRVEILDDKLDWRQIPRMASEPEIGDRD